MLVFYAIIFLNIAIFPYILIAGGKNDILVEKWKCADVMCSRPISTAVTNFKYQASDHDLKLKFIPGQNVEVLRKPAENEKEQNFWWIKLGENEGYVEKSFIKETQKLQPALINVSESKFRPKTTTIAPTPTFKVTEGTTIYPESSYYDEDIAENKSNGNVDVENKNKEYESKDSEASANNDLNSNKNNLSNGKTVKSNNSEIKESISHLESDNAENSINNNSLKNNNVVNNNGNLSDSVSNETENKTLVTENDDLKGPVHIPNNSELKSDPSILEMQGNNGGEEQKDASKIMGGNSQNLSDMRINEKPPVSREKTNEVIPNSSGEEEENLLKEPEKKESFDMKNTIPENKKESVTTESNYTESHVNSGLPNDTDIAEIQQIKMGEQEMEKEGRSETEKVHYPNSSTNEAESSSEISSTGSTTTVDNSKDDLEKNNFTDVNKEVIESKNVKTQSQHNFEEPVSSKDVRAQNQEYSEHESNPAPNDAENKFDNSSNMKNLENIAQEKFSEVEKKEQSPRSLEAEVPFGDVLPQVVEETTNLRQIPDPFSTVGTTTVSYARNEDDLPETTTESFSPEVPKKTDEQSIVFSQPVVNQDESESDSNETEELPLPTENTYLQEDKNIGQKFDDEIIEDSSQNWFSSVYSCINSLKELYQTSWAGNSIISDLEQDIKYNEQFQSTLPEDYVSINTGPGAYSESKPNTDKTLAQTNSGHINTDSETVSETGEGIWSSFKSMLFLIGSSVVILCFTLGYYYLENVRRDGELVRKNNELASQLFVLEREKITLDEDYVTLKSDIQNLSEEKNAFDLQLSNLKENLQICEQEKIKVEERESKLIKKLGMVEQNYNELRRLLSESKQKGERLTLINDIKKLKESIAADHIEISSLKEELQEKKNEVKSLSSNLQKTQESKTALEERIGKMVIEGQEIAKDYQETLAKMEQTIEENKIVQSRLENDLRKHKRECESLVIQKELAESALQKAHGITSTESLSNWLEVKEVRASSIAAAKEISKLRGERDDLLMKFESAEEKGKSLTTEVKELKEKYENAEREKIEALTKLQVLSNYFKEKETQLQEELGIKEAQWLQKQGDDKTIYQQMKDSREETVKLKELIETLKKEILDQDASYKKIINTTEQKAHENWVSFRRAEIRLKEVLAEAAQLRNRLTTIETCEDNSEDKLNKTGGLDNGDLPPLGSAMSPPFMLFNDFMPPPPLLPPPAGGNPSSRPPPLGRISSPPLVSGDFIPPPPLSHYDHHMYSHIHPSQTSPPLPSTILHKPQPRDHLHHIPQAPQVPQPSARKQKDSQSSNHSSESPLDKTPARKSKR